MLPKEIQYQKIRDASYSSVIFLGLGSLSAEIFGASLHLETLTLAIPLVIIGAIVVISWNKYYDHRIAILESYLKLIVFFFLVDTALFLIPFGRIQEKIGAYLLDTFVTISLFVIFVRKRNQLNNMRQ